MRVTFSLEALVFNRKKLFDVRHCSSEVEQVNGNQHNDFPNLLAGAGRLS